MKFRVKFDETNQNRTWRFKWFWLVLISVFSCRNMTKSALNQIISEIGWNWIDRINYNSLDKTKCLWAVRIIQLNLFLFCNTLQNVHRLLTTLLVTLKVRSSSSGMSFNPPRISELFSSKTVPLTYTFWLTNLLSVYLCVLRVFGLFRYLLMFIIIRQRTPPDDYPHFYQLKTGQLRKL